MASEFYIQPSDQVPGSNVTISELQGSWFNPKHGLEAV